ncbi:hypothetical protein J6590_094605 [Homalodisca vitripennis]|nr:hypothetical protein J6590_094605 [Homalodisca vitripennis]
MVPHHIIIVLYDISWELSYVVSGLTIHTLRDPEYLRKKLTCQNWKKKSTKTPLFDYNNETEIDPTKQCNLFNSLPGETPKDS